VNGTAAAPTGDILLAEREAGLLDGHLARHRRWNDAAQVRIVVDELDGSARIGVYAAPPMGVVSFVQLPLAGGGVPLADVRIAARDIVFEAQAPGLVRVVLPVSGPGIPELAVLPPTDDWQLPIYGVAGDVMPVVQDAVAEFKTRSVSAVNADALAEEIWSRVVFGGVTLRMLHTARLLGMLTADSSRIAASTRTGWKKLTTIRGQIYQRVPGALDRPKLTVVR
jgi:hypothetical protein